MGALLIAAPLAVRFCGAGGAETWVPVVLGAGALFYSLLTDYELGVAKVFSMSAHLWLDVLSGSLLAVSPWLFGFGDFIVWPPPHIGAARGCSRYRHPPRALVPQGAARTRPHLSSKLS